MNPRDGQLADSATPSPESRARLGLGLAAAGRPAYITPGRNGDLGAPSSRSIESMRARTHELLDAAWRLGIRYVDAARSYGRAEQYLGTWLARHPDRRAALTIASKWGYEYVGDWRLDAAVHERKEHSPAMLDKQWPETILALGGAPDIYLIHSVTPDSPALGDPALLARLRRLAATGVRLGLSTSGPRQAEVIACALALADSPFSVVQATWNLLEQSCTGALDAAHAAGWTVVLKEVLANGRLVDAYSPPSIRALATADGQPIAAFALGAALSRPWADIVLTGAVTTDQLTEDCAARPLTGNAGSDALAVSPESYWQARAELPWT